MSKEGIISQIMKLQNKLNNEFLSDDEINEIEDQIEKLKLEYDESYPISKEETIRQKVEKVYQDEKPIIQEKESKLSKIHHFIKTVGTKQKEPEKPSTMDEVHQLKIDFMKAKLQRMIAEEKEKTPKKPSLLGKVLKHIKETEKKSNSTVSKGKRKTHDVSGITGSSYDIKISKIIGTDRNIRKFIDNSDNVNKFLSGNDKHRLNMIKKGLNI